MAKIIESLDLILKIQLRILNSREDSTIIFKSFKAPKFKDSNNYKSFLFL